MTIATLDEVAVFDEAGEIEGLQFDGRARAIQEWQEKQEAKEFAKLVERLQKRNSARKAIATPEGRRKKNEYLAEYRQRNNDHIRELERTRRKAKYDADPVVNTCESCGRVWSPPYEQKRKRMRFCGKKCSNHWQAVENSKKKNRGMRQMNLLEQVLATLKRSPGLTLRELREAVQPKRDTLSQCLVTWAKQGKIRREGVRRKYRYFLVEECG